MASSSVSNVKILLADDEAFIIDIFSSYLRAAGYQVSTAVDGIDAAQLLLKQKFDLAILDVDMPRMNGWQVCERLRKHSEGANTPVIFFTAFNTKADREQAARLGARGFINKPSAPEELLQEVRRVLADSRSAEKV